MFISREQLGLDPEDECGPCYNWVVDFLLGVADSLISVTYSYATGNGAILALWLTLLIVFLIASFIPLWLLVRVCMLVDFVIDVYHYVREDG